MKMMGSKFLMMSLWISSCGIVDMSLGLDIPINLPAAALGGDDPIGNIQCVQKLAPCRVYLNQLTPPPPSCCEPLKEMISSNKKCLCYLIQNQPILNTLNITKDQAMKIPQVCGVNADLSICASGSPSNSTATAPPPPAAAKNAANRVSMFGLLAIMACFLHLIPSLF